MVRPRRLELPRISPQAPQACVSTNSTMAAYRRYYTRLFSENQVLAFCELGINYKIKEAKMLEVKQLNYTFESLQPVMSAETLYFHHDKHYAGYVAKANELMPAKWANKTLEQIVHFARDKGEIALFNQVAQVWNHEFFFEGLSLNSEDREIPENLLSYIRKDYNNIDNLKDELIKTAMTRFGSGWVWLVLEDGHLKVQSTLNAETPCGLKGFKPLWTLDVWEHAYYLDYQNRRIDYVTEVVNNAINWYVVWKRLGL